MSFTGYVLVTILTTGAHGMSHDTTYVPTAERCHDRGQAFVKNMEGKKIERWGIDKTAQAAYFCYKHEGSE